MSVEVPSPLSDAIMLCAQLLHTEAATTERCNTGGEPTPIFHPKQDYRATYVRWLGDEDCGKAGETALPGVDICRGRRRLIAQCKFRSFRN